MTESYKRFHEVAAGKPGYGIPVALLATSTAAPGFGKIGYHRYYEDIDSWINTHRYLMIRFPEIVWIPGPVYEMGMPVIALAYGARCRFSDWRTPECEPVNLSLADLMNAKPADPREQGLMPLVLENQRRIEERMKPEGLNRGFAYSWGPMSIISQLTGIMELLTASLEKPDQLAVVLDVMTETSICWLRAQLDVMHNPSGIFIGDDITGMLSEPSFRELILPCLNRMASEFNGITRVYHNDTPCPQLLAALPETGFDIWHFSHEISMAEMVHKADGRIALMGNLSPLGLGMNGTPGEIYQAALKCIDAAPERGMVLSWGGSMAGETPFENIDALIRAARDVK